MRRIQVRRGTAAQWTTKNPVLLAGELGLETDTGKFKFGDGEAAWSSLSYSNTSPESSALTSLTDVTITSVANGDVLRYSAGQWRNYPEEDVVNGGDF